MNFSNAVLSKELVNEKKTSITFSMPKNSLCKKIGLNVASRKKKLNARWLEEKKVQINEFYAVALKWYASLIKVAWLVFPDQNHDLIFDSHLELSKKEV